MERPRPSQRPREPGERLDVFSETMRQLVNQAERVARFDSTILITGESGVGKERLARYVHAHSTRGAGPFVAVNCGAFSETLIESELFGHSRGAFTGAIHDRAGLFEAAFSGTLFLDEIGELPCSSQVKLLRVLQEREVRRVGENRERRVDVRVIAATNRQLPKDVAEGRFREDLYYRLHVIELKIPPLRERPDDLRGLAGTLLGKIAARMGAAITGYTSPALEQILRHQWPGNVRELENVIERACALAAGLVIDVEDLPDTLHAQSAAVVTFPEIRPLPEVERDLILAALRRYGGNRAKTAKQLRIGQSTLFRKLKQYAIAS